MQRNRQETRSRDVRLRRSLFAPEVELDSPWNWNHLLKDLESRLRFSGVGVHVSRIRVDGSESVQRRIFCGFRIHDSRVLGSPVIFASIVAWRSKAAHLRHSS
jgi:hypothetical protein